MKKTIRRTVLTLFGLLCVMGYAKSSQAGYLDNNNCWVINSQGLWEQWPHDETTGECCGFRGAYTNDVNQTVCLPDTLSCEDGFVFNADGAIIGYDCLDVTLDPTGGNGEGGNPMG